MNKSSAGLLLSEIATECDKLGGDALAGIGRGALWHAIFDSELTARTKRIYGLLSQLSYVTREREEAPQ